MVVGYNHRFGHNKQGDYNFLESQGGRLEIHMVEQHQMQQSKVSSTIIRHTIEEGNMAQAAKLLSHPYIIIGNITHDGVVENLDNVKLLPPTGSYFATIGTRQVEIEIQENRILKVKNLQLRNQLFRIFTVKSRS